MDGNDKPFEAAVGAKKSTRVDPSFGFFGSSSKSSTLTGDVPSGTSSSSTNSQIRSSSSTSSVQYPGQDAKAESGSAPTSKSFSQARKKAPEEHAQPHNENEIDEEGCDEQFMINFSAIRLFLVVLGRWPLTHKQDPNRRGYNFRFTWLSAGFMFFVFTVLFTTYGLIVSTYNAVIILMNEKIKGPDKASRTETQIIEQALLERHTIIVTIMLGSYGVNLITSVLIFMKGDEIAVMFTRWTRFLHYSKLACGGVCDTFSIAGLAFLNFLFVYIVFIVLTVSRIGATTIGGPTVISIMFLRHFLPDDYLDTDFKFVGGSLHQSMHILGLILYFYVILTCNSFMYLFMWLVKSMDNVFFCWNVRTSTVIEAAYKDTALDELNPDDLEIMKKERTTFQLLYRDHIGIVRMLSWFNNMFAFVLEPFILLQLIKIVYKFYLAALILGSNGKSPNKLYVGKYFRREKDYIPVFLLMYENVFMVASMLYACSWLEDTTYESYDEMRKKTLLKETKTDKEAFFYLSMFQSYTSVTRMSVYAAQFFCIDRYSVLHVLSAIMSNFLVVYQFRPLFDMETVEHPDLREKVGNFLVAFEGLPVNHTLYVPDSIRNLQSS